MQQWRFTKPDFGEADYKGEGVQNMPIGENVQRTSAAVPATCWWPSSELRVAYNPEKKLDDFVAENVSDADLAKKYGLGKDKPSTLRIEVKSKATSMRPGDELGGSKGAHHGSAAHRR